MKEVEVGGKKILLAREHGEYYAVGAKCTHYGAPLSKGTNIVPYIKCHIHLLSGWVLDF